ncbi:MAG: hypothetical protein WC867_00755 [Candidatus Pacearchaeota archaeon]|jgi:hypothetical protein
MNRNYVAGLIGLTAVGAFYLNGLPNPNKTETKSANIESIAQDSYVQSGRFVDIREPSSQYENIHFLNDTRVQKTNNNGLVYISQEGPSLNPANGFEEIPTPDAYSLNPTVQGESSVLVNPQTVYTNPPTSFEVPQNQVYRELQVVYYDRPLVKAVGRSLRGVGIGLRAIFRRIFCGRRNIETLLVPTNEPIYYQNQ